jgi:hypothetical protein
MEDPRALYEVKPSTEFPGKLQILFQGRLMEDGVWDKEEAEEIIYQEIVDCDSWGL